MCSLSLSRSAYRGGDVIILGTSIYDKPDNGIYLFIFDSNLFIKLNVQPDPLDWNSLILFSNLLTELVKHLLKSVGLTNEVFLILKLNSSIPFCFI